MATKSVLLTGANSSLAIPAVHHLLSTHSNVFAILTVRNASSSSDANTRRLLETIAPFQDRVSLRTLDLAEDLAVKEFARSLAAEIASGSVPPLASILCNAFYWNLTGPPELTRDGFDKSFQVNYLANVNLVLRLLGSCAANARIILFGSDTHCPGQSPLEKYPPFLPEAEEKQASDASEKNKKEQKADLDFDSIVRPTQSTTKKNDDFLGRGFQRYAISKLTTIAWMYALNRRLHLAATATATTTTTTGDRHLPDGITVIALNPGNLTDSRALRVNTPFSVQFLSRFIIQPFRPLLRALSDPTMRTVGDAAKDVVELAVGDSWVHAEGYFTWKKKEDSSPDSMDEGKQETLWKKTLEWTKINEEDTVLAL